MRSGLEKVRASYSRKVMVEGKGFGSGTSSGPFDSAVFDGEACAGDGHEAEAPEPAGRGDPARQILGGLK